MTLCRHFVHCTYLLEDAIFFLRTRQVDSSVNHLFPDPQTVLNTYQRILHLSISLGKDCRNIVEKILSASNKPLTGKAKTQKNSKE